MTQDELFTRYQELQRYVGWEPGDAARVRSVAELLDPALPALVDDFYAQIEHHPNAARVITGGAEQVKRLKATLIGWLRELLSGVYDAAYVARRWQVGWRHVEIGLEQVYTNVALSRLRRGLLLALEERWADDGRECMAVRRSLNTLMDLDLALIEDAYQVEYTQRQQRVERLATIGQVAGGVAHELRNPLNVVKTSVYYLLNARAPSPEKTAEHLGRIERHVVRADGVITALSNFARMPTPEMKPFAVGPFLQEVLDQNAPPDNVDATITCAAATPPALADVEQMRIVFGNLFRNAREAMPDGGRLRVAARGDGDHVVVSVADTGVGIEPQHMKRILEPLYSTKARGLGLGLALARAILDKNQGGLRVESEPGKGSTFTVRLRAAPPDGGPRP